MIKKLCILVFVAALFSCTQQKEAEANTELLYFDIQGYFAKEGLRMQKLNPTFVKTVNVNGNIESKKIKIADWEKEFTIFTNADINKNSWKGSFQVNKQNGEEVYTSDSKKIPVKKLTVLRKDSTVRMIQIVINNKNILFQSNDTLTYYPDSLYAIKKKQKIRILNEKNYQVIGKLK